MELQEIVAFLIIIIIIIWAIVKVKKTFAPNKNKCSDCASSKNCDLKIDTKDSAKVTDCNQMD